MAVATKTVAGVGDVTLDYTAPVSYKQTGGDAGALVILDSDGSELDVTIEGVGGGQVFSSNASGQAAVDAIVAAFAT